MRRTPVTKNGQREQHGGFLQKENDMEEYSANDVALADAINGAYASVSHIKSPIKQIKQLRACLESLRDAGLLIKLQPMMRRVRTAQATTRRTGHRQRQEGSRSSAASGDGNDSDPDSDPERRTQTSLTIRPPWPICSKSPRKPFRIFTL